MKQLITDESYGILKNAIEMRDLANDNIKEFTKVKDYQQLIIDTITNESLGPEYFVHNQEYIQNEIQILLKPRNEKWYDRNVLKFEVKILHKMEQSFKKVEKLMLNQNERKI